MHPSSYGLPHDSFRPHQLETIQWLNSQRGVIFLEAPTGSGKTSYASALANSRTVDAIVKTKNLQAENYEQMYAWDVLYGKSNYPCVHPQGNGRMADECLMTAKRKKMSSCWRFDDCPYIKAVRLAEQSPKLALNYALWMTNESVRENPPQVLVLDEGDELPDIVTGHSGVEVGPKQQREWGLPSFPKISGGQSLLGQSPVGLALGWLHDSLEIMRLHYRQLQTRTDSIGIMRFKQCERIGMELQKTYKALQISGQDWYIRSNPGKFFCKPLTAKYHWQHFFNISETVIIMSATIGNPDPLAAELGIEDFTFRNVPSAWSVEDRPIYIPEDCPRLGRKAKSSAYDKQADLAAEAILERPGDWYGIILTTSKAEARNVMQRLARRGLEDRLWLIPEKHNGRWAGTETQTALWQEEKQRRPGAIMVSWNHWRGFDGLDEKICLVFKAPFPRRGEPGSYEYEHMRYGGSLYQWRTANLLAQGVGRTRRGRPQDYGPDNGLVGVFDGNWRMVKKHLPEDFREAIVH